MSLSEHVGQLLECLHSPLKTKNPLSFRLQNLDSLILLNFIL